MMYQYFCRVDISSSWHVVPAPPLRPLPLDLEDKGALPAKPSREVVPSRSLMVTSSDIHRLTSPAARPTLVPEPRGSSLAASTSFSCLRRLRPVELLENFAHLEHAAVRLAKVEAFHHVIPDCLMYILRQNVESSLPMLAQGSAGSYRATE